ncbi:YlxM family DNA-binding protein [Eubacteriales bacterium OttesenSCG-928-N14]|nr:YlxM family DNA-binding protein [Eubacteriales bacterium OttesenSCG-928-N14]
MDKKIALNLLMDFYGNLLTERQQRTMEYYCGEDFSLSEIAEQEGISRQGVRDAIVRSEKTLYELEEKLGLAQRYMDTVASLNRVLKLTDDAAVRAGILDTLAIWDGE